MKCVNGRTKPALWEKSKRQAVSRLGRHSARAMQLAGKLYRDAGGGYCGAKTQAQRKMVKWTGEDWRTAPGAAAKACKRTPSGKLKCDRYLPAAAWAKLTPAQRAETRRVKLKARTQYVPNAPAAASAGRAIRRRSR